MRRWWRGEREVCAAPEPICAPERRAAAARSGRGVDEGCRAGRAGSVRSSGMRLSTISCYGFLAECLELVLSSGCCDES